MPEGATVDVTVRLQALGGTWETCGADRAIKVDPETLTYSHNEWGAMKASFSLHRSPIAIWPDISAFSPVEIEVGGVLVWEGRTDDTPLKSGAEQIINVQCNGYQYHLDDDVYQRMYVHSKLSDWTDVRSSLAADLSHYVQSGTVSSGKGLTLGWPAKVVLVNNTGVAAGLDMGVGQSAKRIVLVFKWNNLTTNAGQVFEIHASDVGIGAAGSDTVYATNPGTGAHEQAVAVTLATARRYLWIEAVSSAGGNITPEGELNLRLTSIAVFADTAYESGNTSVLHASTVVEDALERATMLLSNDYSQIAATSFAIPDFAMSKMSTPREAIEAANAYHNWISKLESGKRVAFRGRPTDATLEIGAWSGASLEDASANSGAEIYNRAVVEATAADGSPLVVERVAAQQPGVLFLASSSPAPENPSFTVDTASWAASGGAFARVTGAGEYHSAPGAGKWTPNASGQTLTEQFAGTFKAGLTYALTVYLKSSSSALLVVAFGVAGDQTSGYAHTTEVYEPQTIFWTPATTHTGVTLTVQGINGLSLFVDDLSLAAAEPTLVDRRGFRRTKVIQMSSAITPTEGNQLADIFLQAHTTTPFKGSAAVSPGGVRRVLGGQPVHPSQLGLHTTERLRLSHLVDPDTGGVGRDGVIAEVTYTHKDQKAAIVLDDKRGNFDALLARLAVVQSVGS
jgi:hypothetical protein